MVDQLKARIAAVLCRPIPMKPQTERQLAQHLAEHDANTASFLLCASQVLEDYELDIVFGPLFTPTLDQRAELADVLLEGRPTDAQVRQIIGALCDEVSHVTVRLPDGTDAALTTHEVMIERFVRLLRLDGAPEPETARRVHETLSAELAPLGVALLCERGMSPRHQAWFAAFVDHMADRRVLSRELLIAAAEFIAGQRRLEHASVVEEAEALMRATEGTAAQAAGGHAYWSPDVAQHHHYRGQGRVDQELLDRRQGELACMVAIVEDLRTFEYSQADDDQPEL